MVLWIVKAYPPRPRKPPFISPLGKNYVVTAIINVPAWSFWHPIHILKTGDHPASDYLSMSKLPDAFWATFIIGFRVSNNLSIQSHGLIIYQKLKRISIFILEYVKYNQNFML